MRRGACVVRATLLALLAVAAATSAHAQDFRGAIGGRITDAQGGRLPGATVTVVNIATNAVSMSTTDANGDFTIPYLTPGSYRVTVELQGFKKNVRDGVEVRIGDRLSLDLALEVGQLEETVTVAADTPLLESRSGSAGQVIDEKRIALMPLSDGNPFVLARLAPGVAYHGDLKFSRPFDNGGTSDFTADGGPGRNEFTLDGSPNMANGRRVAFVPPAGAVQEFKVETATFDAQQGHTAGATVNVTLKSGSNAFKGDAYYHYRDEALSGNDFFLERAGRPKDDTGYKRYGFTLGGPAIKNRTFFFGAFEWLYDTFPEPGQFTVPTEAQRRGDFSALLPNIVIYDPLTAVRRADGRVQRQPFPGNIIPQSRLDPIALEYLKYYPMPNQAGTAQGVNNYISANSRGDDFYSMNYRVDHTLSNSQRFFVRYSRNNRVENRGNWTGELNGIRPVGNFLFRINDALNADHVWTITPATLLNMRGGWSRFQEPSIRQNQGIFDPASLGFPASASQVLRQQPLLPSLRVRRQFVRRSRRHVRRRHQRVDLFVPADDDADARQAQLSRRLRLPCLSRGVVSERALGRAVRLRPRRRLDASARQLARGGDRTGSRGDAARLSVGRHDRPQHRPFQPGDLRRRVRSGRLEGQQQADRQPRAALGIRKRTDGAGEPQFPRLRPGRDVGHHRGGTGRVCRQPDSAGSGQRLPRPRRAALSHRRAPRHLRLRRQ